MRSSNKNNGSFKIYDMILVSLFAVFIAICSWITVPAVVPFTLQTFGVLCTLGILGGKRGTLSIVVYLLLGFVGLPVFSGFKAGVGTLLGATGGYVIGFVFIGIVYWMFTKLFGNKALISTVAMSIGLILCYVFGTAWFVLVYVGNNTVNFSKALTICVLPFIIPDVLKLVAATVIIKFFSGKLVIKNL